jgi:hypothetical protein
VLSSTNTKRVQFNAESLSVDGVGISRPGLVLVLIIAVVAFATDSRWWAGFIVLAFVPVVFVYGWALGKAGLTTQPMRVPITDSAETLRAQEERCWGRITELEHQLDRAGVPADIPIEGRLDYLVKQRDGIID